MIHSIREWFLWIWQVLCRRCLRAEGVIILLIFLALFLQRNAIPFYVPESYHLGSQTLMGQSSISFTIMVIQKQSVFLDSQFLDEVFSSCIWIFCAFALCCINSAAGKQILQGFPIPYHFNLSLLLTPLLPTVSILCITYDHKKIANTFIFFQFFTHSCRKWQARVSTYHPGLPFFRNRHMCLSLNL